MSAKLLLAGYFGCGNLGDDAILLGFLNGIDGLGYEVRALAGNLSRVQQLGVTPVPRKDLSAIKEAIKQCDAVVFPGGSIFQDVTSSRSAIYYSSIVHMAKKADKKVLLLSQGIGPLKSFFGKRSAVTAFNLADQITVRDAGSVSALGALGVTKAPRLAADMAFLLPEPVHSDEDEFQAGGMKAVGIAPRPWGKKKDTVKFFSELSRLLVKEGFMPLMIPMDSEHDSELIQEISNAAGGKIPSLKGITNPSDMMRRLSRLESVIAVRLHAGILAAAAGVPPYLISYDPKVTGLANSLGLAAPPTLESAQPERIVDGFKDFISRRDSLVSQVKRRREELAEEAKVSIEVLNSTLG
jgi:polysaccharide pyruvyl transferase CsaB